MPRFQDPLEGVVREKLRQVSFLPDMDKLISLKAGYMPVFTLTRKEISNKFGTHFRRDLRDAWYMKRANIR